MARYCAKGHPTHPDPPSHPLVRLPCGCAIATCTDEAFEREHHRLPFVDDRERIIRSVVTGGVSMTNDTPTRPRD